MPPDSCLRLIGTSVAQIDATLGHLMPPDSDHYLRGLLDDTNVAASNAKGAERPQRVSLPAKPPLGSDPCIHTPAGSACKPCARLYLGGAGAWRPFLLRLRNVPLTWGRVEVLRLHMPQTGFSQTAVTVSLGGARSNRPSGPFLSQARRLRAPAHCFPRKGAVRLGPPIAPAGRKYHPVHVLPAATVARDDPGS